VLFNSFVFLFAFLPSCLFGYQLCGRLAGPRAALAFLVAASLLFYAWWNPAVDGSAGAGWNVAYLGLLLTSLMANYALGLAIASAGAHRRGAWLLALGVIGNLGVLGWFKYAGFLAGEVGALLGVDAGLARIVLPLGISFITFQKIAWLVDRRRAARTASAASLPARVPFLDFALFVTFFPQLIAGPIVHHHEVIPQFARCRGRLAASDLAIGLTILSIGLAKKVLLADSLAPHASPVFAAAAAGQAVSLATAWGGALAYAGQLYFDFSGYCDMAVGAARLFGIVLPANFAAPYRAGSIIEFWRRWHMTLSRFLRDYLYIPLGGSRCPPWRHHLNLFLTMLLGGLWHGAGWTFVVWGALHGGYLAANHLWREWAVARGWRAPGLAMRLVYGALTFLAVLVGWVVFRSDTLSAAGRLLAAMAGGGGSGGGGLTAMGWGWIAVAFAIAWGCPTTQDWAHRAAPVLDATRPTAVAWSPRPLWAVATALLFAASVLGLSRVSEFLYFQF